MCLSLEKETLKNILLDIWAREAIMRLEMSQEEVQNLQFDVVFNSMESLTHIRLMNQTSMGRVICS